MTPARGDIKKYGAKSDVKGGKNAQLKTKVANTVGPLPHGWVEYQTPQGETFFHNYYTDESTWDMPTADTNVVPGTGKMRPKKAGHVRTDGRSSLPPCMVMVVVLCMLFAGFLRSLWMSVMKCLGMGPADPNDSRMVAQEQEEFVGKLDRSEIQLVGPLKPPEMEGKKPGPAHREKKPRSPNGIIANMFAGSPVVRSDGDDYDVEGFQTLEPPSAENFSEWAPKLASIWGNWLTDTERKKLHHLVLDWSKDQVVRWNLADRPLHATRSEVAPDLERCDDVKAVLHKQLNEYELLEIQRDYEAIREESAQNCDDVISQLDQLKEDLRQRESRMQDEAADVDKRRQLLMQLDPSYEAHYQPTPIARHTPELEDTLHSTSKTSLMHLMRQSTRKGGSPSAH